MLEPPVPVDEADRLEALRGLGLLDTPPEERFDRVTRLAQRLFDVPIVLVSLVDTDRQWFKSCIGLGVDETGREVSFCAHAILQDEVFVVEDTLVDQRFADNPLVVGDPHIRFYAGYPLSEPGATVSAPCASSTCDRDRPRPTTRRRCAIWPPSSSRSWALRSCVVWHRRSRRARSI